MYKQGSSSPASSRRTLPGNLDANVGVFGFPPATAGGDNPVEGGGDMLTLLNDSDNVKTVVKAALRDRHRQRRSPDQLFLSPHKDFDLQLYPTATTKTVAGVAYAATAFLFDGSDQMPGAVGAGSFWKEMTAWISGNEDTRHRAEEHRRRAGRSS